ncbi:DUF1444 domain-containing protein [Cerasibacillus terrae]|uniref:UPF0354 protein FHP05_14165 n=1 Tax=Cerasibacillus terrae TaxID=2498845 RepID=A0A5C8NHE9_9BACI|nr:DUF1444 domain-containing protein [Cerasibacillus terrae]TXL60562.1 DUF1444 domain-containing protein [Cerasibacillus terrae]
MKKMTSLKLKRMLEERLSNDKYRTSYNRNNDTFRVEWKDTKQGVTITLPTIVAKYNEQGEEAVDAILEHIQESLKIMHQKHDLEGMEKHIFPVIRATSFPVETNAGEKLIFKEHTAETRIFYALDLGKSYRLIDASMLEKSEWTQSQLDEMAMFNLRSLSTEYKVDRVAGNDFYFVATQDGYDASRLLNESFLTEMKENAKGELVVAVPHQDVLIFADVENKTGYDILAHMTMQFFTEGRIPITALSFTFEDNKLIPIFIMAKNKPEK